MKNESAPATRFPYGIQEIVALTKAIVTEEIKRVREDSQRSQTSLDAKVIGEAVGAHVAIISGWPALSNGYARIPRHLWGRDNPPLAGWLLITIASFAGERGIFPSQETLARATNIPRRTVRRYLDLLESAGQIARIKEGRRTRYHIIGPPPR